MSKDRSEIAKAARRCYGIIDDIYAVAAMLSTPAQPITPKQVRAWVGNPRNPTSDYWSTRVYPRRTRDRAVSMYVDGEMSMAAVARKIGCSPGTVKRWLLEADVTFRNPRSILTLRSGHFKKLFMMPSKKRHLSVAA